MNRINKKHYNNLSDSIITVFIVAIGLVCCIGPIVFVNTGPFDYVQRKTIIIAASIIMGLPSLILLFMIIKDCFGYYIIYDDKIFYRNLHCKKTIVFGDVKHIEVKTEKAWVLGVYKTELLAIHNDKKVIKIFINKKNKEEILKFADMLQNYPKP